MNYILTLTGLSQSVSISASQIMLGVMTVWSLWVIYKEGDLSIFRSRMFLLIAAVFISAALTAVFAPDLENKMKSVKNFWIMAYIPVSMFAVTSRDSLRTVTLSAVTGGIIAAVYGITEFYTSYDSLRHFNRADGFFSHPLTYGNSLVILITVSVFAVISKNITSRKEKLFHLSGASVMFAALLLSGSRGPMLSLIVTVCLMVVPLFGKKSLAIGAGVILVCAVALSFSDTLQERYSDFNKSEFTDSTTSFGTRIVLWETSLKIVRDNPVFGIGYGNFKKYVDKYNNEPLASKAHSHNSYLYQAVIYGLTGLAALLLLLGGIAQELIKASRKKIQYAYPVLAAFVTFLLCGLTEYNLGDSEVAMLMWLLAGSVMGVMFNGDSA
ncbi:O-antigen ligase family protein [Geovibrio thiophilus]|uniref:O-antigen ligase family protein n=1 Tax=Geovibrio thiophilus TaxID=139438 RepID=A0A3R5XYJ2_9BACT|nr:O-antigen ligase family protein [Geovibrio thiophilus]QAR33888.1 O-antigen ligase family protein [Geovibrio thiophilus]